MQNGISLKRELTRKIIHLITSLIPLAYFYYSSEEQILVLCISLFILFLVGDILRIYVIQLRQIYEKIFGKLLREHETEKSLNGATLLFLGFTLAILLYEKNIAVIAMLLLSVSDSLAAIVGKSFGNHRFFNKTLEGSLAFFISAFIIILFFYDKIFLGLITALTMAIVELVPNKINDNIVIPIMAGLLLSLANKV